MSSQMFPFHKRVSPIQMLLLLQLKQGPKYGYEMLKNIREEFEEVWEPQTGTIYPALRSLENRNIVVTETRDETDFYILTNKGNRMLKELGKKVKDNVKFTFRFMEFLYKWIPEDMIDTVVDIIHTIAEEDPKIYPHLIQKLDEDKKISLYESIKRISNNRVNALEAAIAEGES